MIGPLGRTAYVLSQGARVGLYWSQYLLSARMTARIKPDKPVEGPFPDRQAILADLRALLERDLRNIEAGLYRLPHDLAEGPMRALGQARRYFADLPEVERRRRDRVTQEVFETGGEAGRFPRYYLQNFHFQTDGYLSRHSAELYDHQVEVLFAGGADAMRRQALVPLHDFLQARRVRASRLLDVGCGTGRFLGFVKDNYPRLAVTALDLSPAYLAQAKRQLRSWRGIDFHAAPAEASGLPDASHDVASAIFLFHELPRKVRRQVAAELHRILKPGGLLLFVDSLQRGDHPDYDGLLALFPHAFHEPYYADYTRQDLSALFEDAGFAVEQVDRAFFSRVMVMRRI